MRLSQAKLASLPVLAVALGALVLPGGGCTKSGPDIKIGVIAELTGDVPAIGASCRKAAELAVKQINDDGGVEVAGVRHVLRLVIEDSGGKPEPAAEAAKKLIDEEKVIAIVGPNASFGAVPAAAVAEAGKTLLLTPAGSAPRITVDDTGATRKWVYRACFTDVFGGKALAKFAYGYIRARKAAVLYNPASDAPKSQAEQFKKDFEAMGGQIVAFETYSAGETDLSAQFKKIAEAGPDLVFLPCYYSEVANQLKQAHAAGIKAHFLGSDNWSNPSLIEKSGADVDGAYFSAHYSPGAMVDAVGKFRAAFEKAYGGETPDDVAALTYDSMELLKKALKGAKEPTREALLESFASLEPYDGVTGKIVYKNGSHDPVKSVVMKQFKGGKATFVTNIDPD